LLYDENPPQEKEGKVIILKGQETEPEEKAEGILLAQREKKTPPAKRDSSLRRMGQAFHMQANTVLGSVRETSDPGGDDSMTKKDQGRDPKAKRVSFASEKRIRQ